MHIGAQLTPPTYPGKSLALLTCHLQTVFITLLLSVEPLITAQVHPHLCVAQRVTYPSRGQYLPTCHSHHTLGALLALWVLCALGSPKQIVRREGSAWMEQCWKGDPECLGAERPAYVHVCRGSGGAVYCLWAAR